MIIHTDSTYIGMCHSSDVELQKSIYYEPRASPTIKVMTFTDQSGKILGIIPLCSSKSPSSGDGYLLKLFNNLMDITSSENYFRRIIRGNNTHFVIIVMDGGYV